MTRKRFVVLGEPTGWHAGRLAAALAARGHGAAIVPWRVLSSRIGPEGEAIGPPVVAEADLTVVRGMPGGGSPANHLEEAIFRMNLLGRIAARGKVVINSPRSLEVAIDKHLSLCRLRDAGVPVPRTAVVQDVATAQAAWTEFGGPCVLKPLFGSRGRGLALVATEADLVAVTAAGGPVCPGGVAYIQEFVPHAGWDVRIVLVGDRAFAMRRLAAPGEWRTNIACGGRGEAFKPTPEWTEMARRAANAVGTEIAGVDLLPAADGRVVVLEVNGVPGWRGLEAFTGQDVTGSVVSFLEGRAANR